MSVSPMVIHFYNKETNEVEKQFTRTFVPWKLLKEAIKLNKELGDLDPEKMSPEDADKIMNFMISVFGGQFTVEEADEMADMGEILAVLTTIMSVASGGVPKNPTLPGK